uniref:Uncharacterized protein n=1 Tax=Arundo donax TaxID=35708 RepID=A0A0A9APE3_ARUDO
MKHCHGALHKLGYHLCCWLYNPQLTHSNCFAITDSESTIHDLEGSSG